MAETHQNISGINATGGARVFARVVYNKVTIINQVRTVDLPSSQSTHPHSPPLEPQDIEMQSSASPLLVESDSDVSNRPRAQGLKRKAHKQPENHPKPILRSAKKAVNYPKEDSNSHTTAHPNSTSTNKATRTAQQVDGMETPQKAASAKVSNAISNAQQRTRKETEMKVAMWGRIAKAVDEAMEAEPAGTIESHHVEHIVNAILHCSLPFQQRVDKAKAQSFTTGEKTEQQYLLDITTQIFLHYLRNTKCPALIYTLTYN